MTLVNLAGSFLGIIHPLLSLRIEQNGRVEIHRLPGIRLLHRAPIQDGSDRSPLRTRCSPGPR
jgi:hypothetical protein